MSDTIDPPSPKRPRLAASASVSATQGDHTLVWFRTDLRVLDNHALHRAALAGKPLIGLFVLSPGEWKAHDWAPVKVDFVLRNLHALRASLSAIGIPLFILRCEEQWGVPLAVANLVRQLRASSVYWNIEYEVNELKRDAQTNALLNGRGVKVVQLHDQCIIQPGSVRTKENKIYNVFTPFKRAWIAMAQKDKTILSTYPAPGPQSSEAIATDIRKLSTDPAFSTLPGSSTELGFALPPLTIDIVSHWPAGEQETTDRLEKFLSEKGGDYEEDRNFPWKRGTSRLSPYLASGVISTRTCLLAAKKANHGKLDSGNAGLVTWISELIWREFYRCILVAYPRVCMNKAFKADTDSIPWSYDKDAFEKWAQGRTGYPIVDAGMRQLNETGWMHNRLRMVVAMFLTKHLLIDWRMGEKYFMQRLIDGDFASNNGGWQWASSTGTDSQPYFRIFNPLSQSERFDKDGKFIRKYVKELAGLQGKAAYDPANVLSAKDFAKLGYPRPMVEHKVARERCLETFKATLAKLKK